MFELPLHIDPAIVGSVRLGIVRADPVEVRAAGPELEREIQEVCEAISIRFRGMPPGEIPGLAPARELYRASGVDPTKTRPSSEALVRRVLQGKPFPAISNAVDVCNICSIRFLLSIGLYDAERVEGSVVLRRGHPGESYPGIRKDEVHLDGRLVLSDRVGAFGNPSSDSLRTSVSAGTRALAMVIFAPASYAKSRLEEHVSWAEGAMRRHLAPAGLAVLTAGLTEGEA